MRAGWTSITIQTGFLSSSSSSDVGTPSGVPPAGALPSMLPSTVRQRRHWSRQPHTVPNLLREHIHRIFGHEPARRKPKRHHDRQSLRSREPPNRVWPPTHRRTGASLDEASIGDVLHPAKRYQAVRRMRRGVAAQFTIPAVPSSIRTTPGEVKETWRLLRPALTGSRIVLPPEVRRVHHPSPSVEYADVDALNVRS